MNKIQFIAKMSELAEEMAKTFGEYVADKSKYFGKTDDESPICVCSMGASIQHGKLATVHFSLGSVDSAQIKLYKHPDSTDTDWSIEENE